MEAHQSSRGVSTKHPSGSFAREHLLHLLLEKCLEVGADGRLAPQKAAAARANGGGERHQQHQGLARAGDHHLLAGKGLVHVARQVGLGVVEVDLQGGCVNVRGMAPAASTLAAIRASARRAGPAGDSGATP